MSKNAGASATIAAWEQSWKGPAAALLATAAFCFLTVRFAEFARLAMAYVPIVVPIAVVAFLPMHLATARQHPDRWAISVLSGLVLGVALIGLLAAGGMVLVAALLLALCGWVIAMAWVNLLGTVAQPLVRHCSRRRSSDASRPPLTSPTAPSSITPANTSAERNERAETRIH